VKGKQMKDKEAKTKWCPFARSTGDGDFAANRNYEGGPDTGAFCIGSKCMAWNVFMLGDTRNDDEGRCGLVHETNF
jgi:hypothetical protein